jgi:hypothetical protein
MGHMSDDTPTADAPTPPTIPAFLADAVLEIERHVAGAGWDGPVRVFALVSTAQALAVEPDLATQLPPDIVALGKADARHLISVEQDGLATDDPLEDLLAHLSWPGSVDGAAVVVERVVLPTQAQESMPDDPDEALGYLASHPDRAEVRMAVGALRSGESWCVIRSRSDDETAIGGPDLVPGLVDAIAATLSDDEDADDEELAEDEDEEPAEDDEDDEAAEDEDDEDEEPTDEEPAEDEDPEAQDPATD